MTKSRDTADIVDDVSVELASKVDYATPANAQSGTGASAYTFVLADATRLTTATGTSAKTFTIPPQSSVVWLANSIIRVANYGAGNLTIAGGSGVTVTNATKTLAPYESAALVRTGSNAWTLLPFSGGAGNADFSNAATGTYSDSGIDYKYLTLTASGTLTVTKAGFADVLVIGGGGSGGVTYGGGGGAGGYLSITDAYLPAGTATVVVGAGGAAPTSVSRTEAQGRDGITSRVGPYFATHGGGGAGWSFNQANEPVSNPGHNGGSGGGSAGANSVAGVPPGGSATSSQGNAGGTGSNGAARGGGGGGGAGTAGGNGSGGTGGAGGDGATSSITGSAVTRAGGGGGYGSSTGGTGGSGGGGAGGITNGTAATANTGGGGGGGDGNGNSGGAGGSGVVIVRVRT